MNESFSLQFPRTVTSFTDVGLLLGNETSIWPMGLFLSLVPGPTTVSRFKTVQQRHDWRDGEFFLHTEIDGQGRLRFSGFDGDPKGLPAGTYDLRVAVGGLKIKNERFDLNIREGGEVAVTLEEKEDPRQIVLETITDDAISAIIGHADSKLDGLPAIEWLRDAQRRPARKACLLNILATARVAPESNVLTRAIESVFFADIDRIYTVVSADIVTTLQAAGFTRDATIASIHQRLKQKVPVDGSQYRLESWREDTDERSLQVVVASPQNGDGPHFADIDIDLGNPFKNPRGFLIHVGELLDPAKTDHLALFDKLSATSAGEFLYYRVEPMRRAAVAERGAAPAVTRGSRG